MKTSDLSGQDLVYWVARANNPRDPSIFRSHYGEVNHGCPSDEPSARLFVERKLGAFLPPRHQWQ